MSFGRQKKKNGLTRGWFEVDWLLQLLKYLIFPLEQCADQWKPHSRTSNSQESKRDVTEKEQKEEDNVIESSMSSELSELSVRSEDDAGR